MPDRFASIKLLVLDFDGVLTDNRVLVTEDGHEAVLCHRGDGWGLARLREAGCEVIVLSTEQNPVVSARCRKLKIPCYQGCDNKAAYLKDRIVDQRLEFSQVAYIGNDVNDLECLGLVGLPIAVADAEEPLLAIARFITSRKGGFGAVREVCDRLIEARRETDSDVFLNRSKEQPLVAFIPLRGGSKSIPLKNIRPLAGHPLAHWTISAALDCTMIDRVFVATDSDVIRAAMEPFITNPRFELVDRSDQTATDTASTEEAMLEFASQHSFGGIVLIQATSPLLRSSDLSAGIAIYQRPDVDSVLSAVRQKRFYWRERGDGTVLPINYDFNKRPRRQDFEGTLVENGAFYLTSREALLSTRCRLSGRIAITEMPEESFIELDEPQDWDHVESLLTARSQNRLA